MASLELIVAVMVGALVVLLLVGFSKRDSDSSTSSRGLSSRNRYRGNMTSGRSPHYMYTGKSVDKIHRRIKSDIDTVAPENLKAFRSESGWKKVLKEDHVAYKAAQDGILELIIPKGATVVCPRNQGMMPKLRTNIAYVNEIYDKRKRALGANKAMSIHQHGFYYYVGEKVEPDKLDESLHTRCSNGIHFFTGFKRANKWFKRNAPRNKVFRPGNLNDRIDKRRREYKKRRQHRKNVKKSKNFRKTPDPTFEKK